MEEFFNALRQILVHRIELKTSPAGLPDSSVQAMKAAYDVIKETVARPAWNGGFGRAKYLNRCLTNLPFTTIKFD